MADVLIVEDELDIAEVEAEILASEGYSVRIAADGLAGLAALDARLPDVVVLDVDMPRLNGPGMAEQMFARDRGSERVPIVLSSANLDLDRTARRVGTEYVLRKPASMDRLLTLVARAAAERRPPRPEAAP